jgi:hypothetical protein
MGAEGSFESIGITKVIVGKGTAMRVHMVDI